MDKHCGVSADERLAAMAWTRLAEGKDVYATALVESFGYAKALQWLYDAQAGATVDKRLRTSVARWCGRLDTKLLNGMLNVLRSLEVFLCLVIRCGQERNLMDPG